MNITFWCKNFYQNSKTILFCCSSPWASFTCTEPYNVEGPDYLMTI